VRDGFAQEFADATDVPLVVSVYDTLPDGGQGARLDGVDVAPRGIQLGAGYRPGAFEVFFTPFKAGAIAVQAPPPPSLVLSGHAASFTPY
jgi:hypothetical protein